ncbi:flavin monoamine oxidase family protein [Thetidibacter halocola]|uniref:FAD-dependent oxidoreductase n=1 Tax=Thetidibacter halocola TaxID=2827239 RepID=A0A8J7WAV9_9RHOB|nr:NAD(P)/FAD-dependent oxidoreductase [Thetidibacter halocola]MBS0124175.1 FAD-dependent oxidoreductase [Thetidibacter halocola]
MTAHNTATGGRDRRCPVVIVGGGLAGLALADRLHRAGVAFRLVEARSRLGGRIMALDTPQGRIDLGPSWFWPGQPRIARLIEDLGLRAFEQFSEGEICFEDTQGAVHRGMGFASMAGSFRVEGGLSSLVEGLAARLPPEHLTLSSPVRAVTQEGVLLADGGRVAGRHVVLALPPRLVAGMHFDPPLPDAAMQGLRAIPTWMAGHAKFVAVYDRPFWREAGLSGDAMSRHGPLAEIHDACGPDGRPAALFGFIGVPADLRAGQSAELRAAALAQLTRLFGPDAAAPTTTALQDWSAETATASWQDRTPPRSHPDYGLPGSLARLRDGRLHLAATETAPEMGGLMEGALASAERVAALILTDMARPR